MKSAGPIRSGGKGPNAQMSDQMIPAWVDGTLMPVEKLSVHQRGLRHKAVSVFLTAGDHVLLQRRALGKYHTPGLWANTCCTHPFWQEAPEECAVRRLHDELGITGHSVRPIGQIEYRADVGGGMIEHEVVDVFHGLMSSRGRPDFNPAEVMDVRWISVSDLAAAIDAAPATFTPWLQIYIRKHFDQIFAGITRPV